MASICNELEKTDLLEIIEEDDYISNSYKIYGRIMIYKKKNDEK